MEMLIFPPTDKNSFLPLRMKPEKLSSFRLMLMEIWLMEKESITVMIEMSIDSSRSI
jgi:hypothetical protein